MADNVYLEAFALYLQTFEGMALEKEISKADFDTYLARRGMTALAFRDETLADLAQAAAYEPAAPPKDAETNLMYRKMTDVFPVKPKAG
jgi:hypothetical protein